MATDPRSRDMSEKPVYRRRWFRVITILIVLGVIILIAAPYGIGYGAKRYLLASGADNAVIEDVDFNPFTAELGLDNVQVLVGGEPALVLPEMKVRFRWISLFKKRIYLQYVKVRGVDVSILKQEDGQMRIGGVLLPEETEEPVEEEAVEAKPWGIGIDSLEISDSDILYHDPKLDTTLRIGDLGLTDLASWKIEQGKGAELAIVGEINNAPYQFDGWLDPFSDEPGMSGTLVLESLSLEPFAKQAAPLETLSGEFSIDTELDIDMKQDGSLRLVQDGKLGLGTLHVATSGVDIENGHLQWTGKVDLGIQAGGEGLEVQTDGELGSDQLAMQLPEGSLALQLGSMGWKGTVKLKLDASGSLQTGTQGVLSTEQLALDMPADDLQLAVDGISWDGTGDVGMSGDGALQTATRGALSTQKLVLTMPANNLKIEMAGVKWDGQGDVERSDGGALQTTAEGLMEGNQWLIDKTDEDVELHQDQFQWKGRLVFASGGEQPDLDMKAGLDIQGLHLDAPEQDVDLVSMAGIVVKDLSLEGLDQLSIARLDFNEFVVGKGLEGTDTDESGEQRSLMKVVQTTISDISLVNQRDVSIRELEFKDVTSIVRRDAEGVWNPVRLVDAFPGGAPEAAEDGSGKPGEPVAQETESTPEAAAEAPGETPAPAVRIDRMAIVGESQVIFNDEGVKPTFQTELNVIEAEVLDLDSTKPDQPSPARLDINTGRHAKVKLTGTAKPFAEYLSLDLQSTVEALPILFLSVYIEPLLGYSVASGQLDAETELKVDKDQLDGETRMTFNGLEVEPVDEAKAAEMESTLSLPLGAALDMLRDKNGTIKLTVPISGDIASPEFDPSDALNQAIAKAVKQGALTYLSMAIQPYGALVAVAKYAGDAASSVRLAPVVFQPGSAELDSSLDDYLEKVAKIMQERPEINIRLCGVAVYSDRVALRGGGAAAASGKSAGQEAASLQDSKSKDKAQPAASPPPVSDDQLMELADQRAMAVKDRLVDQYKASAKHLVKCNPGIDSDDAQAEARVDLLI